VHLGFPEIYMKMIQKEQFKQHWLSGKTLRHKGKIVQWVLQLANFFALL
jgi:hypothetical protein